MADHEQMLGRYRLLRTLGQGGVGVVHLGCSHGAAGFEKLVAIKVLKAELTEDPEQAACLRDEARIGVELDHHNIVQILDLGQEANNYFIVMEYIRGFSLAKVLSYLAQSREAMPVRIATHIFRRLCSALDYVHGQKALDQKTPLFHGDVSAGNVMIGASGRVAFTDFGVAALMHHRPEQLAGKWSYVPPEALLGARVNFTWDLFALGTLYYEMLSGRKAFPSTSFATRAQVAEVCPPLHELRPEVGKPLSDLVARFTTPVLSERFESARAMQRALDAVIPANGEDEHHHNAYFSDLFAFDGFKEAYGALPTTGSIRNEMDPYMEETEMPTARVRVSKPLRFGLSLAHGAERAKGYGELLATCLTRSLERPLRPVLLGDYQTLVDCLLRGDVDVAWMPPLLMAEAAASGAGLVVVAERQGSPTYQGALFVRADSSIESVEDLRGKTAGWVDSSSASGYHFPKHILESRLGPADEVLSRQSFLGSHKAVCEAVANGWVDVGGTYLVADLEGRTTSSGWSDLVPERAQELRLLDSSLLIPGDCIGHRPNFSEQWLDDVRHAFASLADSPEGRELLEHAFVAERFVPGELETYEAIMDVLS